MALEEVEKLKRPVTMEEIKTFVIGLPAQYVVIADGFTVASPLKQQLILHCINYTRAKESFLSDFVGRKHNSHTKLVTIMYIGLDQCHM